MRVCFFRFPSVRLLFYPASFQTEDLSIIFVIGQKLLDAIENGEQSLQQKRSYKLSIMDLIASGGNGYEAFRNFLHQLKVGDRRFLGKYSLQRFTTQKTIAPSIDGQMQIIAAGRQ